MSRANSIETGRASKSLGQLRLNRIAVEARQDDYVSAP